jgi:hypothetical protein
MDIELRTSTGVESLDDLLRGLITLFEMSFPARIRSYYLGGSHSDGTAVGHDRSPNSSDVDLFVIFRGTVEEAESATFHRLLEACQLISPISLDAQAYSEDDLLQQPGPEATQMSFLSALIQVAGMLVYGDDLRPLLPPVPFSRYVLDVIESGVFHLGIPRQKEGLAYPLVTPLSPPLAYPDPDGDFYGYDVVPARPDAPHGTRVLVALTAWIATLILALSTGRYAGQKSQSLQLCQAYLPNDRRTQLAAAINALCKETWGYALPGSDEDRERLRALCRDTLALENEYLLITHDYVLVQLRHGGAEEKRQATRILQSVVYRDDETLAALQALLRDTDERVRAGAAKALERAL